MNFKIGNYQIGTGRVYIIAEIGNNHNGSFDRAIEMVDLAHEMGADCVKFQMRHLDQVYRSRTLDNKSEDLGTEYVVDLLKRFELTLDEQTNLFNYCLQKNIQYLCTPWDEKSIAILEKIGVPAYKVASADLTNLPLIETLVKCNKPLILSTGMSSADEIGQTVALLKASNAKFALLHCNSTYPAPLQDINLKWMARLADLHPLIGYSGHERGINVSLAAVALGACIIERHFTLDRNMEGPDHAASLTMEEFNQLIQGVREIETALGDGTQRHLSQGEMINRENLGKSLVAAKVLSRGTKLSRTDIKVRSPGQGLSPQRIPELIGKSLQRDMEEEDFFYDSDLAENRIEPRNYSFRHPWGIPVRYHDFREYNERIKPDLWEFHFSYSDMELNPNDFLNGPYESNFVVHAPELFSHSKLMDLASPDDGYRNQSFVETQRIINITKELKKFFPRTEKPMIVANIGGFSMDAPIPEAEIQGYYERFGESLSQLDLDGIELIPQTMAPFPWHFGGQRYQNLFVKIEEILEWCEKLGLRMCFDVSHTSLTCNHLGIDIYDFCKKIAPITAHIHMGDAQGVNGEGLQIGEGELDFDRLGKILNADSPEASFIPEIWQGHKNGGEGFWIALDRLEKYI
jgi:sialic acid synthase SpsE/sugar phosphate isomerase/epimerase